MADNLEKDLENFLTEHGVTLPGMLNILGEKNASCMQMSEDNHSRFCELYDEVFEPSNTTKNKGDKLENLTELLFVRSFPNIFDVVRNCRTSSNEIDLIISWTSQANSIGLTNEFSGLGKFGVFTRRVSDNAYESFNDCCPEDKFIRFCSEHPEAVEVFVANDEPPFGSFDSFAFRIGQIEKAIQEEKAHAVQDVDHTKPAPAAHKKASGMDDLFAIVEESKREDGTLSGNGAAVQARGQQNTNTGKEDGPG